MLSKEKRFHGHAAVKRVYGRGKTARASYLSLKFAPNERRQTYRVAVAVSKQVSKSAAVRNRIRRRVYETVRHQLPEGSPAYDLVFTVFDEKVAEITSAELAKIIKACLKQAKLGPTSR